jgi:hypothetical protein
MWEWQLISASQDISLTSRSTELTLFNNIRAIQDRLCGLVVTGLGYRSGGPGSIPGTTRIKKLVGLERGPLSLVSTTEELLDRKVAAPVEKTENTAVGIRHADKQINKTIHKTKTITKTKQ